eukprot:scaffold90874_cov21-Tisochrysis_lutea.AAC.2
MVDHPNIVRLKHCFYSTTEKDETYLHLVLEFVPDTVYRISKHYAKNNQRMPNIFVKLYAYQMCRALQNIHRVGICHRDIKPQNLLVNTETHQLKLCDFGSAKVGQCLNALTCALPATTGMPVPEGATVHMLFPGCMYGHGNAAKDTRRVVLQPGRLAGRLVAGCMYGHGRMQLLAHLWLGRGFLQHAERSMST